MQALHAGEQAIAAHAAAAEAAPAGPSTGEAQERELRTAAAVHAHAFAAAAAALAENAPAAVRGDPAVLRAVLLPLLQTAASGPPFVAAEASAAVSALCTCTVPSQSLTRMRTRNRIPCLPYSHKHARGHRACLLACMHACHAC